MAMGIMLTCNMKTNSHLSLSLSLSDCENEIAEEFVNEKNEGQEGRDR